MPPSEVGPDDPQVLDAAFGHGYLLLPRDQPAGRLVERWPTRDVAGHRYHLHPRTRVTVATGAPGTLVLLGDPLDVGAGIADPDRVAARLLATWRDGDPDAVVREAAYLGGRWTAFLHPGDEGALRVVPDCAASQPVSWADGEHGPALGSSSTLVADALGLPPDPLTVRVYQDLAAAPREHRTVMYPPGQHTEHEGVRRLPPNHLLEIGPGPHPSVRCERFWPWSDRVERTDLPAVFADFRERLTAHVGLITGLGRTGISLTAGGDSRTSLAALVPHRRPGTFAFTYYNPRQGAREGRHRADLFEASGWAWLAGLGHLVLRWRMPGSQEALAHAWRRMFPVHPPSVGAANSMYLGLPRDLVQLASNLGEIGTANPMPRRPGEFTPRRLAELWQSAPFAAAHDHDAVFADYREATTLTPRALAGYDLHDVFYWEHRMGAWGVRKYAEGDVGHRVMLPFNDRLLLETMLSLPVAQREAKVLFVMMQDATPELAGGLPTGPGPLGDPGLPSGWPDEEDPVGWRDLVAARPRLREELLPRIRRRGGRT
ncbi:hypothetical protein [Ornithinicoccus hortensis]|uniref:Asparagine synthase (Glutamine-hydrolysing) n=1 Tax=Ornithinicoccus hortensis TaxID=82346 RepID=A0A542YMT2_9MICO|nr:hypothetical protein [Ornithinicoccus hortensis]TQL49395.1 asparagine synthase (glutamine-hydrolysing) [Ornithinicoccus hortensis]